MTNIMLNTQLYQKMYAEQEQYNAYAAGKVHADRRSLCMRSG